MYAARTEVTIGRSQEQIRSLLTKYGATAFGIMEGRGLAMLTFELKNKRIAFKLPLPPSPSDDATQASMNTYAQLVRAKWRALLLAIKAKLECVESGITTLEQEFLAHIVLPGGKSFGDIYIPQIEQSYRTQTLPPLIEGTR